MKFRLNTIDFDEEINYNQQSAKIISTDMVLETTVEITKRFGKFNFREIQLEHSSILLSNYQLKDGLLLENTLEQSLIEMHFNLDTAIGLKKHHGVRLEIGPMTHNLFGLRDIRGLVDFNGGKKFKTFDIHLDFEYLKKWAGQSVLLDRFIEDFEQNRPALLYPESKYITPDMQDIISQILQCPFTGFTRKIYLESKIQELFALQIASTKKDVAVLQLRQKDVEQLHFARSYIENNLSQPKTIDELARLCGTNQQLLKTGFKILFGTTVFGHLQKCRMKFARDLLQQGHAVSEVAFLVGYSNHSSFSHAFKMYYGFSPIKIASSQ